MSTPELQQADNVSTGSVSMSGVAYDKFVPNTSSHSASILGNGASDSLEMAVALGIVQKQLQSLTSVVSALSRRLEALEALEALEGATRKASRGDGGEMEPAGTRGFKVTREELGSTADVEEVMLHQQEETRALNGRAGLQHTPEEVCV